VNDPVWTRDEIESPCTRICVIHPETRLCTGCARSADEIAQWTRFSPQDRRAIMEELPQRQAVPSRRRGGRASRLARTGGTSSG